MKQFKVIEQLQLIDGILMCKKPSGHSYQRAHYRQGDLDGACGAYSLAMTLNILGVFKAEDFDSDPDDVDNRIAKFRLIKALNEYGLYRKGLKGEEIRDILSRQFSKFISVDYLEKDEIDINDTIRSNIDNNTPVIVGIDYNKYKGHWIVAVGYEVDKKGNIKALLTLDPGNDSPTYCLWNGVLSLDKIPRKTYGYPYNSSQNLVDISEILILHKKH